MNISVKSIKYRLHPEYSEYIQNFRLEHILLKDIIFTIFKEHVLKRNPLYNRFAFDFRTLKTDIGLKPLKNAHPMILTESEF